MKFKSPSIMDSSLFWIILAVLVIFHWVILPILVVLLPFVILIWIGSALYSYYTNKSKKQP